MAKNYGTKIGNVMLKAKHTQWKAEVDVLYRDSSVLVLRDWPNTPLPNYYIVAKNLNPEAWDTALKFMSTLNTGGIRISVLNDQIRSDFESINNTFMTLGESEQWYKNFIAKEQ